MSAVSPAPRADTAARPAAASENSLYTIVVVRDVAGLRSHLAAWDDLSRQTAEPNPFYEPWAMLPAMGAFAADPDRFFVLVYQPINAQRRHPVLCGFFPLRGRRLHRLCPARVVEMAAHDYCFLRVPLLRAGHAVPVLDAFLDWLRRDAMGGTLWQLEQATQDGPFAHALTEVLYHRQLSTFLVDSYCRAMIRPGSDAETYLDDALAPKRRREFRRQERLLGNLGRLETRVFEAGGDLATWTEQFLELEASGWKGREGTAFSSKPAHADFFRCLLRGAFERGRLEMLGLFLDDRPIALKCNFLAGAGSFAFKIAFDESRKAFSPGVLLELANVRRLHAERPIRWMDSCAVPGHPMIDRLWSERRLVQTQMIATGRAPGDLLVSLMPLGRWLKRKFRRPAKPIPVHEE